MTLRLIFIFVLAALLLGWITRRQARAAIRKFVVRLCQLTLQRLGRPYQMRTEPCLVVAAHPDDETLGCGALIARKRNEGLPVHVIFISDRSASPGGDPSIASAEVGQVRRREALAALAILGVESCAIHFLNDPDRPSHPLAADRHAAVVTSLAQWIATIRPGEIFLPCSPDGSSEHDAAFGLVAAALVQAGQHPDVWAYPVWSWWHPGLLVKRMIFNHGYCVHPAEDYQLIKTRALARYRSQLEALPPRREPALPPGLVRSCNSGQEFFFRFVPPPQATAAGRP